MSGTITGVLTRAKCQQGQVAKLVLTCTADADAATFPAAVLNTLAVDGDGRSFDIRGLQGYSIKVIPGSPAPTDASDITITDEYGIDLLGGKGTNLISATNKTWALFGPSGYSVSALISGNTTITISNNAVKSAVITIVIELIGV